MKCASKLKEVFSLVLVLVLALVLVLVLVMVMAWKFLTQSHLFRQQVSLFAPEDGQVRADHG